MPVQFNGQKRYAFAVNDRIRVGFFALVRALEDVADHICFGLEYRIQIQRFVHPVKVLDIFPAAVLFGIPTEEGVSRSGSPVQFMHFPRPDGYGIFCIWLSAVQVIVYREQIVAFLPERIQRYILCGIPADALVPFAAVRLIVPPQKNIPLADRSFQLVSAGGSYAFGILFSMQNAAVQLVANGVNRIAPLRKQLYVLSRALNLRDRLAGIIRCRVPAFKHRAVLFGQRNFQQTALHRKRILRRLQKIASVQPVIDGIFVRRKNCRIGAVFRDFTRKRNCPAPFVLPADKIVPVARGRLRREPIVFADRNLVAVKRYGIQVRSPALP